MAPEFTTQAEREAGLKLRSLRVEVTKGPDAGASHLSETDAIRIGTSSDNDLVLTDKTVSRYHLELRRAHDRIALVDCGSTNGVAVGGSWIERGAVTRGASIKLGSTIVRVEDGALVTVELHGDEVLGELRGREPDMRRLMARIERVAASDASVLVQGESGTGKELVARALHERSPRAARPFEVVDCGALMPTLIASELFGHERGAFTGAERQHIGAFERAAGGTLFLDEIGELPQSLQTTLLGVLERRTMRRVGGDRPIPVDVRVVCATNRDLRAEVNADKFRQDLYYRIAVVILEVPPLRERPGDISMLAEHFLREAGHQGALDDVIPTSVMRTLQGYRWPGNVRELRNFVEAALAVGEAPTLPSDASDPRRAGEAFPSLSLPALNRMGYKDARALVLREFEEQYVQALMERTRGNVSEAAREAKMNRPYFNQLVKRHRPE